MKKRRIINVSKRNSWQIYNTSFLESKLHWEIFLSFYLQTSSFYMTPPPQSAILSRKETDRGVNVYTHAREKVCKQRE